MKMHSSKHAADDKQIRKLDKEWGDAASNGRFEEVVSVYAPDGSLVWPDEPAHHGIEAIRTAWTETLKTPGLFLQFTPERIDFSESGDLAVDYGAVLIKQDGGNDQLGKYVVVWKKLGGTWKVLYDCYSLNSKAG